MGRAYFFIRVSSRAFAVAFWVGFGLCYCESQLPPPIENLRERLTLGVSYFNREYFFEAHDAWEELWMEAREATSRDLFHGLVNLATGFYHYRMHNFSGMQSQLQKGRAKLANLPPRCHGIELENLLRQVEAFIGITSPREDAVPLPQIVFHPEELLEPAR